MLHRKQAYCKPEIPQMLKVQCCHWGALLFAYCGQCRQGWGSRLINYVKLTLQGAPRRVFYGGMPPQQMQGMPPQFMPRGGYPMGPYVGGRWDILSCLAYLCAIPSFGLRRLCV